MTRDQFDHIVRVLKKKKIPVTKENIAKYLLDTGNQRSKFFKRIANEKAEKANQFRKGWADFVMTVQYRFRLFGYHFIFYKKGYTGIFWRFDIVKANG